MKLNKLLLGLLLVPTLMNAAAAATPHSEDERTQVYQITGADDEKHEVHEQIFKQWCKKLLEINGLKADIKSKQERLIATATAKLKYKFEAEEAAKRVKELEEQLRKATALITKQQAELDKLQAQPKKREIRLTQYDSSDKKRIEELEAKLVAKDERILDLEMQTASVQALHDRVSELERRPGNIKEIEFMKKRIQDLQQTNIRLEAEVRALKIDDRQAHIRHLEAQIATLSAENGGLRKKAAHPRRSAGRSSLGASAEAQTVAQLKRTITQLRERITELEVENMTLKFGAAPLLDSEDEAKTE